MNVFFHSVIELIIQLISIVMKNQQRLPFFFLRKNNIEKHRAVHVATFHMKQPNY